MKSITPTCEPRRVDAFLAGELSVAEESLLTIHLDQCGDCQRRMETLAAEPASWNEAHEFLQPTIFHETVSDNRRTPLQVQSVLDTLGPADDPDMLGRLGGYEVSGVVGVGGMGVVLKAFDRSLDRPVAIKVLAPHLASSGAARQRFAREARATAAVLHPNVIAIHSVSNNDSLPWLVMPYVRGTSLQKRIDKEGPLPVSEVLRIGSQIAAGLAAAHAQGLVHRDIKPANILLEDGVERVSITDFGLARAVDDATMTRSGIIAGTPQYMSPEQARGESVDGRSDLFSLGSVLYAMCTGHSPFRAETPYGVMRRITDVNARAIQEINAGVPNWLCGIIDKLMAKQPVDRFESSAQVAELLEACLAHVQQPTTTPIPAACRALDKPHKSRPDSKHTKRVGVVTVAAAFLLGALGLIWWHASDPPDIAGIWDGQDWGRVELAEIKPGKYEGACSDIFGNESKMIQLKWSRIEQRFNGTWRDSDLRFGKISIRLVDDEIRGAWTTSKKTETNPGTPRLADLLWTRHQIHDPEQISGDHVKEKLELEIPPGMRIVAQSIDKEFTPAELLESGQLVDVMGLYPDTQRGQPNDGFSKTILSNVLVYSVTRHGNVQRAIIGLLVTKKQSEKLVMEQSFCERVYLARSSKTLPRPFDTNRYGRVTAVEEDKIAVNLGMDDGLSKGDTFEIYRRRKFVGRAVIIEILDNRSAARIDQNMTADTIQTNDRVVWSDESAKQKERNRLRFLEPLPQDTGDPLPAFDDNEIDSLGAATPRFVAGMTLANAVMAFNDFYSQHSVGKNQPPLTQNEVVAAMRWATRDRNRNLDGMSDENLKEFTSIMNDRVLPEFWKLEIQTEFGNGKDEWFQAWQIKLSVDRPDSWTSGQRPQDYAFGIRDQTVCQWNPDATPPRPSKIPVLDDELNPDAMPLSAAIHAFNKGALILDGVAQSPLTLAEVTANIKRAPRSSMPLTNNQYAEFLKIAETQQLPPGYRFEKITHFEPGDGFEYKIWSVRLLIPKTSNPGMTYGHTIRNQFVSSRKIDDGEIAWGPVAENGLQAGIRFEPAQETYEPGSIVRPEFFVRNTGDESFELAFPRIMTHAYYDEMVVVNSSGASSARFFGTGGPVGWQSLKDFGFGAQQRISGQPILLGGERPAGRQRAMTHVVAESGDAMIVQFTLPNYGDKDAPPLATGKITFSMRDKK